MSQLVDDGINVINGHCVSCHWELLDGTMDTDEMCCRKLHEPPAKPQADGGGK